ncbi:MAG: hypothetical protein ACOX0W_00890 [Sphaerochaetaceae bacterium]|jgi:energy-coupling factor transporter transmembrane protein EcfT
MFFVILFVIVLIIVWAFKPSKKEYTVTKTDVETGRTIEETTIVKEDGAVNTAARITVKIIITLFIIVVLLFAFVICSTLI